MPHPADVAIARKYLGKDYPRQKFSYDGSNRVQYAGSAPRGTLTSEAAWFIEEFTYDGSSSRVTDIKTAPLNSVWDDRASLTYA